MHICLPNARNTCSHRTIHPQKNATNHNQVRLTELNETNLAFTAINTTRLESHTCLFYFILGHIKSWYLAARNEGH